jgi:hypothetical protein
MPGIGVNDEPLFIVWRHRQSLRSRRLETSNGLRRLFRDKYLFNAKGKTKVYHSQNHTDCCGHYQYHRRQIDDLPPGGPDYLPQFSDSRAYKPETVTFNSLFADRLLH